MGLTISKAPLNPITSPSAYPYAIIKISGGTPENSTFTLTQAGVGIVFTFKDAPFSSNQIGTNLGGDFPDDWATASILPILNAHPVISLKYDTTIEDVTLDPSTVSIKITSKFTGSFYNLLVSTNDATNIEIVEVVDYSPQKPLVILSKDANIFEFNCPGYVTTAGVKASVKFKFTGIPADSETLTLTLGGKTQAFIFSDAPTLFNHILCSGLGGISLDFYLKQHVIPAISKVSDFARNYQFSVVNVLSGEASLLIESNEVGAIYSADGSETSTVITKTATVVGVNTAYAANYRAVLDVFCNKSFGGNLVPIYKSDAIPNSQSIAKFTDLSNVLESIAVSNLPAHSQTGIFKLQNERLVVFKYAEAFGNPIALQEYDQYPPVNTLSAFTVLNGGSKHSNRNNLTYYTDYFQADVVKFLTVMPSGFPINQSQKQYLSAWLKHEGSKVVALQARLVYNDESVGAWNTISSINTTSGLFTANVSPVTIGITNTTKAYQIRFTVDGVAATVEFLFKINRMGGRYAKTFLFFNSWGCPETVCMTGIAKLNSEYTVDTYQLQFIPDDFADGVVVQQNTSIRNVREVDSGYFPKSFIGYINEFLLSEKRWLDAGKWSPITIENQSVKKGTEADSTYTFTISYKESYNERGNI